jgi:hypothetical protein
MEQEHTSFADATVGGIHKPGGCAVLGMEITDDCTAPVVADGTYRGHGLVWAYSKDASNWGVLFCTTGAAGASTTGDWTVLKMHPDLQWSSGDVTWGGAHEFDATVCFDGEAEFAAAVDFSADATVTIGGDLTVGGTAHFDGTVNFNSAVDFSADVTVSIPGDLSVRDSSITGMPVHYGQKIIIKGWAYFDGSGAVAVQDSYNVDSVCDKGVGVYKVNWDTDFGDANYCVIATRGRDNAAGTATVSAKQSGSVYIRTGVSSTGSAEDATQVYVLAVGTH